MPDCRKTTAQTTFPYMYLLLRRYITQFWNWMKAIMWWHKTKLSEKQELNTNIRTLCAVRNDSRTCGWILHKSTDPQWFWNFWIFAHIMYNIQTTDKTNYNWWCLLFTQYKCYRCYFATYILTQHVVTPDRNWKHECATKIWHFPLWRWIF